MAVARSSSDRVTKSQGNGAALGFSSSLITHCTTYIWEPYKKRLNWSRCRLGWWGPRNSVLRRRYIDSQRGRAISEENMCQTSLTHHDLRIGLVNAAACSAHDRGIRLIASLWRVCYRPRREWDCTPRGRSVIYMIALFHCIILCWYFFALSDFKYSFCCNFYLATLCWRGTRCMLSCVRLSVYLSVTVGVSEFYQCS